MVKHSLRDFHKMRFKTTANQISIATFAKVGTSNEALKIEHDIKEGNNNLHLNTYSYKSIFS